MYDDVSIIQNDSHTSIYCRNSRLHRDLFSSHTNGVFAVIGGRRILGTGIARVSVSPIAIDTDKFSFTYKSGCLAAAIKGGLLDFST